MRKLQTTALLPRKAEQGIFFARPLDSPLRKVYGAEFTSGIENEDIQMEGSLFGDGDDGNYEEVLDQTAEEQHEQSQDVISETDENSEGQQGNNQNVFVEVEEDEAIREGESEKQDSEIFGDAVEEDSDSNVPEEMEASDSVEEGMELDMLNASATRNIAVNTFISDSFLKSSDEKIYKFSLSSDGYISLEFNHDFVDSGAGYWRVYLYDSSKEYLTDYSYSGKITKNQEEKLGLSKGTYYIKVINGYNWTDKSYQLRVNYKAASNWETEFNEDYKSANALTVNQTKYGSQRKKDDIDFYKFRLTKSTSVRFSFQHKYINSDRGYWRIYVYNSSMKELYSYIYYGNVQTVIEDSVRLSAGTYYLKVTSGNYDWSDIPYQITVNTTPGVPSLKKVASVDYNKIQIVWNAVSGATGYAVFRKEGNVWKYIGATAGTSYIHTSSKNHPIVTDKTYRYTVRAYRKIGSKYINGSVNSTGKTGKASLKKPSITKITVSTKGLNLQWNKINGAHGYVIYRYENGKWIKKGQTSKLSFVDSKVKKGYTYKYKIRAYRKIGSKYVYSAYSTVISKKR
ncbi:MAG: hypothetical protein SOY73_17365 [Blautia sp.]|nr:hypothetical protein [Blautia sp.]MDY4000829.1 hypothetical protein [Blautia sp.]